ncbi:RagB/SusD family nutrient uptake outer membrane protein [Puia dinghuensis]|uniref:Membrane protein n=1 Tax=Puia dinghuensis TaxID=1792502 RepID=A0A8J2UI51_9BACT|nr:RagB/SusD family nutrient uptake outer membrane protein [Puia dinghuensis]GGB21431.1 membrane protein [Puia dinghuensis]
MKTFNHIFSITGSLALSLLALSCSKQLNQQPPSTTTTAQFYSNTNDFLQAVTGAYNQLRAYPDEVLWMGEMRSDNIYATSDGNRDWQLIRNFSPNLTTVSFVNSAWDNNFNGIYNCNSVLDNLVTKGTNVTDPNLRARFAAECHFLRAFYYFQLVRLYGEVPIVQHVMTASAIEKVKRSSVSDVYNLIISDLNTAIDSLPNSYTTVDIGRATKWAAKGLLGLVYLTRSGPTYAGVDGPTQGTNEWNLAMAQFNDIIASGQFTFGASYPNIFSYTNENNPEVLFDVQFMSTNNGADFPSQLTPLSYWGGVGIAGTYGNGYGSCTFDISKNLRASYAGSMGAATDVRDTFNIDWKYPINTSNPPAMDTANPFIKKYINIAKRGVAYNDWPINFIVMRYTDVLMMKAECILNGATGGAQSTVDSIVNLVRKRAGIAAVSHVTLPMLMEERRREFLGEGIRWNDLVREGMAVTTINNWITADGQSSTIGQVMPAFVIYPVPEAEMLTAPGLYTQNPGYQ